MDGNLGSQSFSNADVGAPGHGPVAISKALAGGEGEYPAGLVLVPDANGDLVRHAEGAAPAKAFVLKELTDSDKDGPAVVYCHGTVRREALLVWNGVDDYVAATAETWDALADIGIWAI